eukprot:39480-Chlamydomonas_euryale.AAC.1
MAAHTALWTARTLPPPGGDGSDGSHLVTHVQSPHRGSCTTPEAELLAESELLVPLVQFAGAGSEDGGSGGGAHASGRAQGSCLAAETSIAWQPRTPSGAAVADKAAREVPRQQRAARDGNAGGASACPQPSERPAAASTMGGNAGERMRYSDRAAADAAAGSGPGLGGSACVFNPDAACVFNPDACVFNPDA